MSVGPRRMMLLALALLVAVPPASAHGGPHADAAASSRLPLIGPAPDFTLANQDGRSIALRSLRGRPVVLTFIYTSCRDVCPLLTDKLVEAESQLRRRTAGASATRPVFLAITVDPETDTRVVLRAYGENHGAPTGSWHFLTGTRQDIEAIARGYGVMVRRRGDGDVDHTMLTSLIDRQGRLRVQYLGYRFAVGEFVDDLASLIAAP